MSSTYVIGDVHGNYNGLVESLQKMGWKENEDRLIFVGDLVDRGIANKKVIDFVAEHKDTVHIVLGNHELQHKKMVQYYRILAKNPTVRKLAAGIFLRFTERERIIRAYDEISALRCDINERKEFLNNTPKTFLDYQEHFIVYTMAWEDDTLWKLMLYLLDEMCGAPYDAQHTIYEYLTGRNKTRERFEAVFSNTAAEFVINTTDALARYQSVRMVNTSYSSYNTLGKIEGAFQLSFPMSYDPIRIASISNTRCCVSSDDERKGNEKVPKNKDRTMGRFSVVEYGLYHMYIQTSTKAILRNGVTEDDLKLLIQTILHMFDDDMSSVRPSMTVRKVVVVRQNRNSGRVRPTDIEDAMVAKLKPGVNSPTSFNDYNLEFKRDMLPDSVEVKEYTMDNPDGIIL